MTYFTNFVQLNYILFFFSFYSFKYCFLFIVSVVHYVSFAQYCQPNEPYDQIVSDYHSTAAKKQNGKWVVWGECKAFNGVAPITTPQEINSTNYPRLTGDVLKVALGSANGDNSQMIILTTTGIFALGTPNTVLLNDLASRPIITKLMLNGNTMGLPDGVNPTDVKILTATSLSLGLLTTSGSVWMLTQNRSMSGIKVIGDYVAAKWSLVHDTNLNPLTNISQLRISTKACFAVSTSNVYYTWGASVINNGAFVQSMRAIILDKPSNNGFEEPPVMIGVSPTSNIVAYYTLLKNGKVYGIGGNGGGALAQGTSGILYDWVSPKINATTEIENISFLSVQEHNVMLASVAVITKDKKILVWGENQFNMIGGSSPFYDYAVTPDGFDNTTDEAEYLEMGGHTLIYVKGGSDRYCYLGHRINGSMGDGTIIEARVSTADCSNTAPVDLCVFCPKISNNTIDPEQHHCLEDDINRINGVLPTVETTIPNLSIQYRWVKSVNNTTQTINSNTQNYNPGNLSVTTSYYRLVKTNTTLDCPYDTSNVSIVTIYDLPDKPLVSLDNLTQCTGTNVNLSVDNYSDSDPISWFQGTTPLSGTQQLSLVNITEDNAGKYYVKITNQNDCSATSDTIEVTPASPAPTTKLSGSNLYCQGKAFYLSIDSVPGFQYSWMFDNQLLSSTKTAHISNADSLLNNGVYTLTIVNKKCPTTQTFNIKIKDCKSTEVVIPDGFSPNNDGLNDVLEIKNIENYPSSQISIFNRWGVLVYHAAPYLNNWNGTNENNPSLGGSKLPEGTYFYVLTVSDSTQPIKGSFYLKY